MSNIPQAAAEFPLSIEQKRQAALLYHFTSTEHLDFIIQRVRALAAFMDTRLDYAERVERDRAMRELGWDESNMAANWATYAHPFLVTQLQHLYRSKANRAMEAFEIAGVRGTLAGLEHFSKAWTLPEEEDKYYELSGEASDPANDLDSTIERTWHDYDITEAWEAYKEKLLPLPTFRVRTDVQAETGQKPPRTGVYVPQDDPLGTLQFAWTGGSRGALKPCVTLSEVAREYVTVVGRQRLWKAPREDKRDPDRAEITDEYFDDWCFDEKGMKFDRNVLHSVNPRAFTQRPCKWYFVERIEGEYEDEPAAPPTADRLRGGPGTRVPRSGWWYTPSIKGEQGFRYFEEGSRFPDTAHTEWGAVFWQFDPERQPK